MEFIKLTGDAIPTDGNKSLYHIPEYQREYAWGTNIDGDPQIVDFWNDIWNRCWLLQRTHFIGTILCVTSSLDGKPCYDIVDGQQRITTLFLLTIAIRDFLKKKECESYTGWTTSMLDADGQSRLVLSDRLSHDKLVFDSLLMGQTDIINTMDLERNRMVAAHRWFIGAIDRSFSEKPAEADAFARSCLSLITLLFVTLEKEDDAPTIFATLNDRGRPVDDYEKLRSTITMAVPQDTNLSSLALTVWRDLESYLDEGDICDFLAAFSQRLGYVTIRRTANDEIKKRISDTIVSGTFPAWLNSVKQCLSIYLTLMESPDQQGNATGIMRLEVESVLPLVLAIVEKEGFDSHLLPVLESILVRHLICYDRPGTRFLQLRIESCDIIGTKSDGWEEALLDHWRENYTFTNQEFLKSLVTKRLYGPGVVRRRLLYLLEKIENSQHELGQYSFVEDCTIEHIIPQTLTKSWQEELANAMPDLTARQIESLYEAKLNTLGNLTILLNSKQPVASNRSFNEKVALYREKEGEKRTYLNSYFDNHHVWDLYKVETRSRKLAQIASEIWKNP